MYLSVTSHADELWNLADRTSSPYMDSMKRAILTQLGMYMTDECFANAEEYLKYTVASIYWGVSEDFFNCILQNLNRLKPVVVTNMLINNIREQHFHLGRTLANILLYLKIANVPINAQKALCKALEEKPEFIISNGGHPQFITSLVMHNKEIFEVLASVPNNGLQSFCCKYYTTKSGLRIDGKVTHLPS